MQRDPNVYQIMIKGQPIKVADANRDQIEQELMRAMDVIQTLEARLAPLTDLIDNFISGRRIAVDAVVDEAVG